MKRETLSAGMFAVAEFKAEILISAILRNSFSVNLEIKKSINSQKISA